MSVLARTSRKLSDRLQYFVLEVLMVVCMKNTSFSVVTPCNSERYQRFGGTWHLPSGPKIKPSKKSTKVGRMAELATSLCLFLAVLALQL
jgi:hypothetical protein